MKNPFPHLYIIFLLLLYSTTALAGIQTFGFKDRFDDTYNGIISRLPEPPDFDFWKHAQELGDKLLIYANMTLVEEAIKYNVDMDHVHRFSNGVFDLFKATRSFALDLHDAVEKGGSEATPLVTKFSLEIDKLLEGLQEEFKEPAPENKTERYMRREAEVNIVLDKIEDVLVSVCSEWDLPEDAIRAKSTVIKDHIKTVILIIGKMADDHPVMLDIMLFFVAVLIAGPLLESLLCRALLRAFGFSPLGPKGSFAAWAQKQFFGAAIRRGSWFARLQAAGMNLKTVFGIGTRIVVGFFAAIIASIKVITGF